MNWEYWIGKTVFLRTTRGKVYVGEVKEVEDLGNGLTFISLIDKFNNWVTVTKGEISEIKEEKEHAE